MTDKAPDPGQLLTIQQVADLLAISKRSVWRLIRLGRLSTRRILSATRIPRADIDKLMDGS